VRAALLPGVAAAAEHTVLPAEVDPEEINRLLAEQGTASLFHRFTGRFIVKFTDSPKVKGLGFRVKGGCRVRGFLVFMILGFTVFRGSWFRSFLGF
jgi:hypothetical protein